MPAKHYPTTDDLLNHPVVSRDAWIATRKELLKKEKQLTRQQEQLSAELRDLPWVKMEKSYAFDTPTGTQTLADLFDGRSQLIIKHFMFAPQWDDGCVGCSFESDHLDATLPHLHHHDVTVVAVSRTPLDKIQAFQKRMGWHFKWVSSLNSDFNYDFNVSFTPEQMANGTAEYNYSTGPVPIEELSGFSVFYKAPDGTVYHTYSTFGRGAEYLMGTYVILDMMPKGRNENGPNGNLTDWVRHHDRYYSDGRVDPSGRYVTGQSNGGSCGCEPKE